MLCSVGTVMSGSCLSAVLINKIIVFGSPPRASDRFSLRFLAPLAIPGHGVGLRSSQKVVGYRHCICATIVPVGGGVLYY